MKKFENLNQVELMETEGGVIDWAVVGAVAACVALYGIVRDVVYDAGKAAAYDKLGY